MASPARPPLLLVDMHEVQIPLAITKAGDSWAAFRSYHLPQVAAQTEFIILEIEWGVEHLRVVPGQ